MRRAQASLGLGAQSSAEFNPHAFLFWRPARLAVIPLTTYDEHRETFEGAVGFGIGAASIVEAGRVTHPPQTEESYTYTPPIERSLVVGETLYTLSWAGLGANRLDTLAPLSFTAFPRSSTAGGNPGAVAPPR